MHPTLLKIVCTCTMQVIGLINEAQLVTKEKKLSCLNQVCHYYTVHVYTIAGGSFNAGIEITKLFNPSN